MATSLLALLDDIASLLDDVAVLSKVAAKKTVGVLGDDLALNAQQVSGVHADRELPVVWAVCKGSFRNKLVLVPLALVLVTLVPWAVTPLMVIAGVYLAYEGVEKLAHAQHHPAHAHVVDVDHTAHAADLAAQAPEHESSRIRGAIRTDFILSAEIIVLSLGTVRESPWPVQAAVLSAIAVAMTVGVYGVVALIVKLDDLGLYWSQRTGTTPLRALQRRAGVGILALAPRLMQAISLLGMVAMFLVSGGILAHGIPAIEHGIDHISAMAGWAAPVVALGADALVGLVAGVLALGIALAAKRLSH
ncbi:DUF808 domain-containing protein [Candidatus Symbiobacter mobilis]|uniref:DUF808 domain-containing protein n=1 Tax=Candidatus Symbiobacter mobilis CR TaxID=946483 RepID=U5N8P5_9BURK|nr:DUF808 domain-containing protein [Candidatus Symbiobacter mobilis]AGX86554.1 hypothetical protein Cenrod_0436 [Candidatus Symbiobacter mobilis CR]